MSTELVYKSNTPQVSMVYRHLKTLEEFVNHSSLARDLQILPVLYQHAAWFINL